LKTSTHLVRQRFVRACPEVFAVASATALVIFAMVVGGRVASAAQSTVGLGNATPFAVLAGTTVTNTGPSVISGDLGVSPGSAVTGFPPGQVNNGTQHDGDAVATGAQSDLTTAYNDAAGRTPATVEANPDLGGTTLAPGVYKVASAMSLTGTVTLDGQSDPNAVFIFQAGSTLITASNSRVNLIGGAQACNVFWQVGSSATLGTNTTFVGSILALTSASVQTGASVAGRVLARNGQVSLDDNTITVPTCTTSVTSSTTSVGGTSTTSVGGTSTTSVGGTSTTSVGGTSTTSVGGTTTTSTTEVIPKGVPQTGVGGAARTGINGLPVAVGGIALVGAGATTAMAIRRRRVHDRSGGPGA
jgi:hypothetical protein